MLFNSYSFIFIFLPITFGAAFWLSRINKNIYILTLVIASVIFYAVWDSKFLLLLLGAALVNFTIAQYISNGSEKTKKTILKLSIILNLLLLGYFKYINFFVNEIGSIFSVQPEPLIIILPLGISFYTFTQIAFLIDSYRGEVREYSFSRYLLFVTYFPHLIAGPILHHKQMMPQFASYKSHILNLDNVSLGLTIFIIGLIKKIVIADSFGIHSTPIFDAANEGRILSFFEAWIGAISYTLQLYFDFSAYSDMAIGLSLIFNIRLPLNFNSPYKSRSIIDFWRRWHMTLSTFLRDYLYIPLGGSRCSNIRRHTNLMITMILGGLWHGAGWTFIIWGALHGAFLIINHLWRQFKSRLNIQARSSLTSIICSQGLTFLAVVVAWVFFRADNVSTALSMLSSMGGFNGVSLPNTLAPLLLDIANTTYFENIVFEGIFPNNIFLQSNVVVISTILIGLMIVFFFPNTHEIMRNYKICWEDLTEKNGNSYIETNRLQYKVVWMPSIKIALLVGSLFFCVLLLLSNNQNSEFLYYQF
jgi:D-alanyl-lipoteichoic acid acyltransferase DltB (MBOAT superfamily)